jgi:hypothetical protein
MKKSLALVGLAALVLGSVSMAMSSSAPVSEKVDEARVQAQIDARLHAVLLDLRAKKLNP